MLSNSSASIRNESNNGEDLQTHPRGQMMAPLLPDSQTRLRFQVTLWMESP